MAYQWDSYLETGFERIDSRHKELISALNNIISAFRRGKGREELYKTLYFLTGYTAMLFSYEEELMIENSYPGFPSHKHCHDEFSETVENLARQLIDDGPSDDLVITVTTTIGNWLLNHIRIDDFNMAFYVKSKEIQALYPIDEFPYMSHIDNNHTLLHNTG